MTARSRRSSAWLAAAAVVALVWSASLVLSPMWLADGPRDAAPTPRPAVAGITYLLASRVCHQRPDRSFCLQGRPMPVCGRCSGLYLSGTVGLLAGIAWRRRDGRPSGRDVASLRTLRNRRVLVLSLAALPTCLTWGAEMVGLWDPGTALRGLAAVPLGLVAGALIARRQ